MRFQAKLKSAGSRVLGLINRIASPVDRVAAKRGSECAPIFVVGVPRSGTTLAYELIVQAFEFAFLTRAFSYTYGLPNLTTRLTKRHIRSPAAHYRSTYGRIPGFFSPAENHVVWDRWFGVDEVLGHYVPPYTLGRKAVGSARKMLQSMTAIVGRPFVFKDVYLALSLRELKRVFPDARFVIVERDFEAICASVYRGLTETRQHDWWSIRPPFFSDFIDSHPVEQTAFLCSRSSQLMYREIASLGDDRCLRISYSSICDSPSGFLQKVQDLAGPDMRRRVNASVPARFEKSRSKQIPNDVATRFDRLVQDMSGGAEAYLRKVDEHVARDRRLSAQ